MGKKTEKTFVVRGFDAEAECFQQPTGVIEDKSTFKEVVVKTQPEAIVAIFTDSEISGMVVPAGEPKDVLHVVDLNIALSITDKLEVRAVKTELREIIKRWAEKSRVKNRRGFRASAIRTPEFVYHSNGTNVKTQVILSNTIIYSDSKLDDKPQTQTTVLADLANLEKQLSRQLDYKFSGLGYNHSLIGKGTV